MNIKKSWLILILFLIISESKAEKNFFGTSFRTAVSLSKAVNQNAGFLDFRWDFNINKIVEIGACFSVLESDLKSDFIDENTKDNVLYELNYGGIDLGLFPIYNDSYNLRLGIALMGGGYKFNQISGSVTPKNYGSINLAAYQPNIEFSYSIGKNVQIDLNASYRYVYEQDNLSSYSLGLGVKYGIFK